jgi:hypothetical protein
LQLLRYLAGCLRGALRDFDKRLAKHIHERDGVASASVSGLLILFPSFLEN